MVAWNPINKSIWKMVKSFWKWSYLKIFKNIHQEDQKNFTPKRDHINARIAQNCLVHKEYSNLFSARRIHTEEKPCKCKKCRQAFSRKRRTQRICCFNMKKQKERNNMNARIVQNCVVPKEYWIIFKFTFCKKNL